MFTFTDLQDYFKKQDFKFLLAADAEPQVTKREKGQLVTETPAGGVGIALEPMAKASNGLYIARGRTPEDKETVNNKGFITIHPHTPLEYSLQRLFFTPEEVDAYYNGFANQTLWPLCHIAFERPEFRQSWYDGYKKVNESFAKSILENIKGKTFVWVNDYQLSLVPGIVNRPKDTTVAFFWHIPWPTWEIFRILPQKKEILESLLSCDFIAFHRGYHRRNFFETVEREFEARIDRETNRIYYNNRITTVGKLPMGIDADIIKQIVTPEPPDTFITAIVRSLLGIEAEPKEKQETDIDTFFKENKVILGVDRLDYTKGLRLRLRALDRFFEKYPSTSGKVAYLGILSPSREDIPAYRELKKEVYRLASEINKKYAKDSWKPIRLVSGVYTREEILQLYRKADVGLVTPLDDGMNLVSKEFIVAASLSDNPGALILSQFAGSSIDLTESLIVNPYNIEEVADAIQFSLQIPKQDRTEKTKRMEHILEERNVYSWGMKFVRDGLEAGRVSRN